MRRASMLLCAAALLLGARALSAEGQRIVTDIHAEPASPPHITVSWSSGWSGADSQILLVYRSTRPFSGGTALSEHEPLARLPSSANTYTDTVDDYRDYYYAVVAEGSSLCIPALNATVTGARAARAPRGTGDAAAGMGVHAEEGRGDSADPVPAMQTRPESAVPSLSPDARAAGMSLLARSAPMQRNMLAVYAFDCDLVSPESGDDYVLFETLRRHFARAQYADAVDDLTGFLAARRPHDVTARALFYRGESHYFAGDYKAAVLDFLAVLEDFPALAKKWIYSALDFYTME